MSPQQMTEKIKIPQKKDELILVVKRTDLFPGDAWHGISEVDLENVMQTIKTKKQFLWRSKMENDPSYKQIIPYLVFNWQDCYFLMQRKSTASEARLKNKYSLGIGGHIRQEDIEGASIFDWARREFYEEVSFSGNLEIEPIGILNDDSNPVGQVHLGLVLLVRGDNGNIRVKSELKSGKLVNLDECTHLFDSLENWSQEVLKHLLQREKP